MADKSKIEWTDATWNPVTGCTRVSEGCRNCYMARTVPRFGKDPWKVQLHPDRLDQPLRWKRPRRIFVNSLSDLFHEDIPREFIKAIVGVTMDCPQHIFQILTKRPQRMLEFCRDCEFPSNVWLGVSVENQETADERIPLLLQTPTAVRFLSCEPLLGPINLAGGGKNAKGDVRAGFYWLTERPCPVCEIENSLGQSRGSMSHPINCGWRKDQGRARGGIDWVIVGGESGPGARPMHPDWARSIHDQCQEAGVPYFFKQWGEYIASGQMTECQKNYMVARSKGKPPMIGNDGADRDGHFYRIGKKAAGALLDGREWREFPQFERGPHE